jgi:DNA polymerase III delta' subunit
VIGWDQIFGQDAAVKRVRKSLSQDKLPHALIFAGPRGVGKASVARVLGATWLCEQADEHTDAPCGKCEACRAVAADSHPDFHVVYRKLIRILKGDTGHMATVLAVDVVREYLIGPAGRMSVMGRGKVFVVEEADFMSPQAQNALLKTLEEPQGRTIVILLTDEPSRLLPTVLSRSQLIRFASLPEDRVASELVERGAASAHDAADAARLSEGSLGVSIEWLKNGMITAARRVLPLVDRLPDSSIELAEALRVFGEEYFAVAEKNDPAITKNTATREGLAILLRIVANHLRGKLSADDVAQVERACAQIEFTAAADQQLEANATIQLVIDYLVESLASAAR